MNWITSQLLFYIWENNKTINFCVKQTCFIFSKKKIWIWYTTSIGGTAAVWSAIPMFHNQRASYLQLRSQGMYTWMNSDEGSIRKFRDTQSSLKEEFLVPFHASLTEEYPQKDVITWELGTCVFKHLLVLFSIFKIVINYYCPIVIMFALAFVYMWEIFLFGLLILLSFCVHLLHRFERKKQRYISQSVFFFCIPLHIDI